MKTAQPGILPDPPAHARYLTFSLVPECDLEELAEALGELEPDESLVVGLGESLVRAVGWTVDGLRSFPALAGAGLEVPSTPAALWCWLRDDDPGELVHATRNLVDHFDELLEITQVIDAFLFRGGHDLTGYEDGTENPTGDAAVETAFTPEGASFVAVQQWEHDLDLFESHEPEERDHMIGRSIEDNEELDEAPESAHVKRAAQESYDPEAFMLRRSMPWADDEGEGLVFVAFGRSLDAFEAVMRRMTGADDGIADALFRFTRPLTGAYFWCPPVSGGRLSLPKKTATS